MARFQARRNKNHRITRLEMRKSYEVHCQSVTKVDMQYIQVQC